MSKLDKQIKKLLPKGYTLKESSERNVGSLGDEIIFSRITTKERKKI